MEYEIDELSDAFWTATGEDECQPNHMPAWFGDSAGHAQSGEWIPEEARASLSPSLEPTQ